MCFPNSFIFIIGLALEIASAAAFASINPCDELLVSAKPHFITQNFNEKMRRFRSARIGKTRLKFISVNNINYEVIGVLGESASKVYLGSNPLSQEKVSIKVFDNEDYDHWHNSIYYEIAVSRFYTENGLIVPRIIDHQIINKKDSLPVGYLVKEYREGITGDDLGWPRLMREQDLWKLEELKEAEVNKVNKIHPKFQSWLKKKKINLFEHPFQSLNRLIKYGDFDGHSYGNWLFDLELQQWILFDP